MDGSARIGARDLRGHHLALVLGTVLGDAPITRAAVSARTGLTRSTVSGLTADLVDGGLLRDIGPGPETVAGRPGHRLVPDPDGPVGVGVQIETDHVGGCLVGLAGTAGPRRWRRHDVAVRGPDTTARAVRTVLRALLWDAESSGRMVAGVVAGVPGVVAADHRTVVAAPALGWSGVDLAGLLEREADAVGATGIAVSVRSGVELAAGVEAGDGPGVSLYLGGRSEVGLVVVQGGAARSGDAATRFGHVPARSGGGRCRCGRRGCVAVEARPVSATDTGAGPAGTSSARDSDRELRRAGRALGVPLAAVAAPLDPVRIILGGRFAGADPAFVAAVDAELTKAGIGSGRLQAGTPATDAVMRGAGRAAVEHLATAPAGWLTD